MRRVPPAPPMLCEEAARAIYYALKFASDPLSIDELEEAVLDTVYLTSEFTRAAIKDMLRAGEIERCGKLYQLV